MAHAQELLAEQKRRKSVEQALQEEQTLREAEQKRRAAAEQALQAFREHREQGRQAEQGRRTAAEQERREQERRAAAEHALLAAAKAPSATLLAAYAAGVPQSLPRPPFRRVRTPGHGSVDNAESLEEMAQLTLLSRAMMAEKNARQVQALQSASAAVAQRSRGRVAASAPAIHHSAWKPA